MKARLAFSILVLLLASHLGWKASFAQTSGREYFEETGHWVMGDFLVKYYSVPDPLLLYGYPITDAFQDSTTKRYVQYFEKALFELHPDAPAGQRVRLAPLGEYLYVRGKPYSVPENSRACRTIGEQGFQVCYDFLRFFDANGGVAQFGDPISNMEIQNGRRVQYFQNARLEWRPDLPAGQYMALADLGRQYFYSVSEDVGRQKPEQGDDIIKGILSLKAHAYPVKAVTGQRGSQTVYIIVQDQRLLPVSNARVTLVVRMPSGEINQFIVPEATNEDGVTRYTFPFKATSVGVAEIQVTVRHENLTSQTFTSFRIWW